MRIVDNTCGQVNNGLNSDQLRRLMHSIEFRACRFIKNKDATMKIIILLIKQRWKLKELCEIKQEDLGSVHSYVETFKFCKLC